MGVRRSCIRDSSSSSGQVNETLGSQIKVRDSATRNGVAVGNCLTEPESHIGMLHNSGSSIYKRITPNFQ